MKIKWHVINLGAHGWGLMYADDQGYTLAMGLTGQWRGQSAEAYMRQRARELNESESQTKPKTEPT